MKKAKGIVTLVVILLLLCGAYFYVSKHPKTVEKDSSSTSESVASVEVWKLDSTKISKIIVTGTNSGNTFVKKAKVWSIENYDHKLNQTAITSVTDPLTNLTGTLVENDAKDMKKYGLDKPIINVAISGTGLDKTLLIGDKSADGANYYASEKGIKSVYLIPVSTVDSLSLKQSAYRDNTLTAIDAASLTYMKIAQAGSSPIVITKNTGLSAEEIQYNVNTWMLTGAYNVPLGVDSEKITTVTAAIANLVVSDIAEDNPKDLSKYGLDKPSMELILKDSKNTLHLFIGKNKDESSVYFKTAEANTVYIMDKTVIDTFKLKPFDVISKFVYIVNIDYVDKIVVDANGKKDIVLLSRTSVKATKAGDPDVVTTNSKLNGKSIEISKFKTQYQEIIGLTVDAENDKELKDKPEISITYSINKGSKKQEVVDFVPYNDDFYAVFRDGKSDFVITKDKVNKMITSLRNLK
ncbi:DUF4340 domain-containing protein [Clostridium lacusfryxellense]|uniref:DUF4340 domain-containing protein n=1 Tax=Clostridium lacusfryxellense TaxID=205328 RepID=UPI001C0BEECC|nr:DUF4340 domain-containing protein [Clostridium lacusfryxellense]MBU3113301.1 DUF4340 domain-containing protein [Clostridium lacusfryxellense]